MQRGALDIDGLTFTYECGGDVWSGAVTNELDARALVVERRLAD
jgi:hypothetical protein